MNNTTIERKHEPDMAPYYSLVGMVEGDIDVIFSCFNKYAVVYELDAERASLKAQGYTALKIVSTMQNVNEAFTNS